MFAPLLLLSFLSFVVSSSPAWAVATEFIGPAIGVIDGDTIEVLHNKRPERVRLNGIQKEMLLEV